MPASGLEAPSLPAAEHGCCAMIRSAASASVLSAAHTLWQGLLEIVNVRIGRSARRVETGGRGKARNNGKSASRLHLQVIVRASRKKETRQVGCGNERAILQHWFQATRRARAAGAGAARWAQPLMLSVRHVAGGGGGGGWRRCWGARLRCGAAGDGRRWRFGPKGPPVVHCGVVCCVCGRPVKYHRCVHGLTESWYCSKTRGVGRAGDLKPAPHTVHQQSKIAGLSRFLK